MNHLFFREILVYFYVRHDGGHKNLIDRVVRHYGGLIFNDVIKTNEEGKTQHGKRCVSILHAYYTIS